MGHPIGVFVALNAVPTPVIMALAVDDVIDPASAVANASSKFLLVVAVILAITYNGTTTIELP
jgi:hypothetical protein